VAWRAGRRTKRSSERSFVQKPEQLDLSSDRD
jgi:hypothetical protein